MYKEFNDNEIPTIKVEKNKDENIYQDKPVHNKQNETPEEPIINTKKVDLIDLSNKPQNNNEEEKFIAEEHVIEYNENSQDIVTRKKTETENTIKSTKEEPFIERKLYQKNEYMSIKSR